MSRKNLFVIFFLAIAMFALAACSSDGAIATAPDFGSNAYRSGVEMGVAIVDNGDGTFSPIMGNAYGRLVVALDATGAPSVEGMSAAAADALIASLTGSSTGLGTFVVPAGAMADVNNSGLEHIQISRRGDAILFYTDGLLLAETTVQGAQHAISLATNAGYIPAEYSTIIDTIFNLASNADRAELDLAIITANHDPATSTAPFLWPARAEQAKFATDGNGGILTEAEALEAAAAEPTTISLDVRAGEGEWSVAARARDEHGMNFDCVFDALKSYRANGGSWRAGTTFEMPADQCGSGAVTLVPLAPAPVTDSAPAPAAPAPAGACGDLAPLVAAGGAEWSGVFGDNAAVSAAAGMPVGRLTAGTYTVCLDPAVWPAGATFWNEGVRIPPGEATEITLHEENGLGGN